MFSNGVLLAPPSTFRSLRNETGFALSILRALAQISEGTIYAPLIIPNWARLVKLVEIEPIKIKKKWRTS